MVDEYKLREKICEIGRRMFDREMVASNGGNISVRIGEDTYLCTPTMVSKGYMTPECICKVDGKCNLLEDAGPFKPSSEVKMHIRVYEKRSDIMACVHAHPNYATTFACLGKPMSLPVMSECCFDFGGVPCAPFATTSTNEVPDSIEPYLPYYDAVLMGNHGALTYAADLETAYMRMESLEFFALQLYQTQLAGGARVLTKEEVAKLYELRRNSTATGMHPALYCKSPDLSGCAECILNDSCAGNFAL